MNYSKLATLLRESEEFAKGFHEFVVELGKNGELSKLVPKNSEEDISSIRELSCAVWQNFDEFLASELESVLSLSKCSDEEAQSEALSIIGYKLYSKVAVLIEGKFVEFWN